MNMGPAYHVRCDCGQNLAVATSAAGGHIDCPCGRRVSVPRLSELKRQAGQAAFEIRAVDRVRQLLADKRLPPDTLCRMSTRPTTDVVYVTVVCETPKATGGFSWWWLVLLGLGGFLVTCWLLPFYYFAVREPREVFGPETVFRLPVPLAAQFHAQAADLGEGGLRALLLTVPLYADLLAEFPQARVSTG